MALTMRKVWVSLENLMERISINKTPKARLLQKLAKKCSLDVEPYGRNMVKLFTKSTVFPMTKRLFSCMPQVQVAECGAIMLKALKEDFHCITVDLPGHGNSRNVEWTTFDEVIESVGWAY